MSMDLDTFRCKILALIKDSNLSLSGVALVQSPSDVLLSASLGVTPSTDDGSWPVPAMANYQLAKRRFQREFVIDGHPLRTCVVISFKMEDPDRTASRWQLGFRLDMNL